MLEILRGYPNNSKLAFAQLANLHQVFARLLLEFVNNLEKCFSIFFQTKKSTKSELSIAGIVRRMVRTLQS